MNTAEVNLYRHVWVVGEHHDGRLKAVTFELLGIARDLARQRACEVWCVLLGERLADLAPPSVQSGADVVLAVDDPKLAEPVDDVRARALVRLVRTYRPEIVLCGATAGGRALMPRVAVQLHTGLTADCTGLAIEPETGALLQTRPAFGGNLMATIACRNHRPQMATVRPRVMPRPEPDPQRRGRLLFETYSAHPHDGLTRILRRIPAGGDTVSLADARFIIAGGRGVRGKAGFDLLKQFAALVGGAVGASRAAVDAGWIDHDHQVGQTGVTVRPRLYIACGISGSVQHRAGMAESAKIVAINKDPGAPIFGVAHYGIVGDLHEVLPKFITAYKARV